MPVNKNDTLTGIVLCGGQSTRMRTDKGLLRTNGKYWAQKAYDTLSSVHLNVKISINPLQQENYLKIFQQDQLIEDLPGIPGPLAGLLSAHRALAGTDLLLLACDMTDISAASLNPLLEMYRTKKEAYDFCVFENEKQSEPMPGIYTSRAIERIDRLWQEGKLEKFSMKYLLSTGKTLSLPLSEIQRKEFKNYNSKEDLQ